MPHSITSIVFVIYFKKCPVLQLLCQAIPFPSNFNKNFFQLLFLFLLLTALFFSVTTAVKVNLYYSVTITVIVNCHLFSSYFSLSAAVTVNWRNTGCKLDYSSGMCRVHETFLAETERRPKTHSSEAETFGILSKTRPRRDPRCMAPRPRVRETLRILSKMRLSR